MGTRRRSRAGILLAGVLAVAALGVSGCTPSSGSVGTPVPLPATSSPAASPGAGTPSPSPAVPTGPVQPAGDPADVVSGLQAPWSVLPVDGSILISQRDA